MMDILRVSKANMFSELNNPKVSAILDNLSLAKRFIFYNLVTYLWYFMILYF
jgi:hypothetical protein